jgi:hypothetical protein
LTRGYSTLNLKQKARLNEGPRQVDGDSKGGNDDHESYAAATA